jgi:acetolactate synthase-1/2/3 large subunit
MRDQQRLYEGRLIGAKLHNPDFAALAASYGIRAARVEDPAGLTTALELALASGEPELIVVPVRPEDEVSPWRFMMPPSRRA